MCDKLHEFKEMQDQLYTKSVINRKKIQVHEHPRYYENMVEEKANKQ